MSAPRVLSRICCAAFAPWLGACLLVSAAHGALILQHNDNGSTNTPDPLPVFFAEPGVVSTPITKSASLGNFSNGSSWALGRFEATINPDLYASVTIEAGPASVIDIESISWSRFSTRTYSGAVIRTSLDGFAADIATGTLASSDVEYDLTALPVVTGPVELRFYFTNEGSSFRELNTGNVLPNPNGTGDGLRFFGIVTTTIPEPTTSVLGIATMSLWLMTARRKTVSKV